MSEKKQKDISSGTDEMMKNVTELNVIIGRNGSGKSKFLRSISKLRNKDDYYVSYLSPERSGTFSDNPNTEHNARHDPNFLINDRDKNQSSNFKTASRMHLKKLALHWGRRVDCEQDLRLDTTRTFETEYLAHINRLLSNLKLEVDAQGEFQFITQSGHKIDPSELSSGESEMVALASEVMYFFAMCGGSKTNLLILDEPDVHLHPDLQAKFARFLTYQIDQLNPKFRERTFTIIATHSTPLICDLALAKYCSIGTKRHESEEVLQRPVTEAFKSVAPFFGHPLSRFIGDDIPLIVEGADDVRIWGHACRTSGGRIRVFPCLATSKSQMNALEKTCDNLMRAIYDEPKAISIRDGDGERKHIHPEGCVIRYSLQCYEMENLLLTDECLQVMHLTWVNFIEMAKKWILKNPHHPQKNLLEDIIQSTDRGRDRKIKDLRNVIIGIADAHKDWEIVVGQAIGRLEKDFSVGAKSFSIREFIGSGALQAVGAIETEA